MQVMIQLETFAPLTHAAVLAIAGLLPIVDPLGSIPIYQQLTTRIGRGQQAAMARAVAFDTFLLLLASTLVGAYVLDFFGLSIPTVQVAGGLTVWALGWALLTKPDTDDAARASAREMSADELPRRAFYPLTMPVTVGPGALSVAVTLGANQGSDVRGLVVTAAGHAAGILAVAVAVYLCYRYAEAILSWLGNTRRTVLMRLFAFIHLCTGVQILWNGAHQLLAVAFPGLTGPN